MPIDPLVNLSFLINYINDFNLRDMIETTKNGLKFNKEMSRAVVISRTSHPQNNQIEGSFLNDANPEEVIKILNHLQVKEN